LTELRAGCSQLGGTQLIQANPTTDSAYRPMIRAIPAASNLGETLCVGRSHQSKARLAQGTSTHVSAVTLSRLLARLKPLDHNPVRLRRRDRRLDYGADVAWMGCDGLVQLG
jgi:hypothetical protein